MMFSILAPFTLGLCFFLLGMYAMRTGFQNLAGKKWKNGCRASPARPTIASGSD